MVAAHILSASAGHGDLRGFYNPRWNLPVSAIADNAGSIKALVRREHTFGSDWIKTQLGMPVAVHTGAAEGCKQAIRFGARSLEHAYLIDSEGLQMAERGGSYIVPTMQMTQEDLHELQAGTLPRLWDVTVVR